jgi:aerobic-type carbon monoxide dehydrogenase small subunit (CoxS/CutS family)
LFDLSNYLYYKVNSFKNNLMALLNLNVDENKHQICVDLATPMLGVQENNLNFTGNKYGYGIAHSGACSIRIDGVFMRSCQFPVATVGHKTTDIHSQSTQTPKK